MSISITNSPLPFHIEKYIEDYMPAMDGWCSPQKADALARLVPQTGCLTAERLGTAVATVSQKSSLCFIVSNLPPTLEQFLREPRLQRRKISLYVPSMRDIPEVPGIPTRRFMANGLEPQAKLAARARSSNDGLRTASEGAVGARQ